MAATYCGTLLPFQYHLLNDRLRQMPTLPPARLRAILVGQRPMREAEIDRMLTAMEGR